MVTHGETGELELRLVGTFARETERQCRRPLARWQERVCQGTGEAAGTGSGRMRGRPSRHRNKWLAKAGK